MEGVCVWGGGEVSLLSVTSTQRKPRTGFKALTILAWLTCHSQMKCIHLNSYACWQATVFTCISSGTTRLNPQPTHLSTYRFWYIIALCVYNRTPSVMRRKRWCYWECVYTCCWPDNWANPRESCAISDLRDDPGWRPFNCVQWVQDQLDATRRIKSWLYTKM